MSMFSLYKDSDKDRGEELKRPSVPHNRSHRLQDAHDDDSAAFLQVTDDTKQVDFYKNPTILSRLLLSNKYSSAIKRVKSHPQEASVWVAMKRNPFKREQLLRTYLRKDRSDRSFQGSVRSISTSQKNFYNVSKKQRQIMVDYSMRQLPLHMACSNLIRPTKPEEQTQLEKLIALLVVTYPDGCEQCDHEGKLPLHEAIWHNASSDTISMMLMAFPKGLHERDRFGRSPLDLNRIRSGGDKEKVKSLLVKGVAFWEQARAQALSRIENTDEKAAAGDQDSVSTMTSTSTKSLRPDPKGNLNPAIRDLSRHIKQGTGGDDSSMSQPSQDNDDEFSVVEPISWVKLEQRAVYLEQLLAGMYEKNYELEEAVEELTRERLELQEELEKSSKYGSTCTDESLIEENERLKEEVATMKRALSDTNEIEPRLSRSITGSSVDSLEAYTDEQRDVEQTQYLRDLNAELQYEVNQLTEKIQEYESQVNRLEVIIAATNRPSDLGDDASVDLPLAVIPEDGSPARPAAEKEVSNSPSAQDDLDSLVESLSKNSRYATERYLAGKVQLLEARLDEEMTAREADVLANNLENKRLLMENAALQSEVGRLSTRNLGGPSKAASARNSFGMANSSRSTFSDDYSIGEESQFEVLLNEAFQLYGTKEASESLISTSTSKLVDADSDNPMEQIRDEVERIESEYGKPVPIEVKMSLVSAVSSLSLGTNTVLDGDGDDLNAFLEEATKFYGRPIPPDLQSAMKGTSLVSLSNQHIIVPTQQPDVDDDLGKLFEEAERLYQKPIPVGVRSAVRDAIASDSRTNLLDEAPPPTKLSPASTSSYGTEEELESILNEAEQAYGKPISADMRRALFSASISSGASFHHLRNEPSLRSDGSSFRSYEENVENETDEIEILFYEAEKLYQKRIPAGVKSVVRNAVASSGAIEGPGSALPRYDSQTSCSLSADAECEMDNIIRDAERNYGRELPADLKVALLTASVSSGLSLRSFEDSSRYLRTEDRGSHQINDELDLMFQEAEILYKQPIPTEVKSVVRDTYASTSDSSLPVSDSQSAADVEEELECIIRDAEYAYGNVLPEDLKHALLTASISSRLPLRSKEADEPTPTDKDPSVVAGADLSPESSVGSDDLNEMFLAAAREFGSSSRSSSKSSNNIASEGKPVIAKQASSSSNVASLDDSFTSDNLEDIFASAGKKLSRSESSKSAGSASTEVKTYLPPQLSTAAKKPSPTPQNVSERSGLSNPDDDLDSIFREAERIHGKSLPTDLKHAVRSASLQSGLSFQTNDLLEPSVSASLLESTPTEQMEVEEDDLEKMFEKAPYKVFNKGPIRTPVDVGEEGGIEQMFEEAMREAVAPGDGSGDSVSESDTRESSPDNVVESLSQSSSDDGDAVLESDANELSPQHVAEFSERSNSEDDLDSIFREAERNYGMALPADLKHAVRSASLKSGLSFRTNDLLEPSTSTSLLQSSPSKLMDVEEDVEEDDLEKMFEQARYKVFNKGPIRTPVDVGEEENIEQMFEEAARLYDKPIPEELMDAMREAVTPGNGHGDSFQGTYADEETSASDSSFDDGDMEDMESIIREAERSNGGMISSELKNALLDS